MPSKAEFYRQMAEQVSTQLVGSWKEWTAFLSTAARLYKYPFHEQMMIYAQRPDATACAEYDLWYRKAGYSKKFREEHEEEILLHQAAKNAFDDMGVKKLPKVKELQAEYARLLEEKKKTYAEYRRSREKMRELLAAKANVDRLMEMDEERQEDKGKEMNR